MKERLIEYRLLGKGGQVVDVFNTRSCGWTEPIEEWVPIIKEKFMAADCYWLRKYGNLRLVAIYEREV